ncbi:MAG TPA: bifunctional diaminohydroxyphosphoribosylaminopyrimidine deaminase/5-amino-6-(5-phosphoribosylamino)uracil reductase RibD [Acidimicrobiales bacterium]|nr:bifunctional diaminohydroxyphosphoribosylaminopyrimidine deaminase/5-amino-6-(5-phosphoribosylamino)uracil reductase RibD [Acidimicrobiales bacterium]
MLRRAVALASAVRLHTSPNPWVGCVLVAADGTEVEGATQPPGGDHAEAQALRSARADGVDLRGATAFVTLEPCSHHGRTPPCADALIEAGVARVVVGVADPDPHVAGRGIERLRAAGVEVVVGVLADEVQHQLGAYLHQRRTGRPWVTLKLAATLDGRSAAPDGSSRWITGPQARADVHRERAEHDAVLVGAGTVRADDPELTVRTTTGAPASAESGGWRDPQRGAWGGAQESAGHDGPDPLGPLGREPLRVVLGSAPTGARVHPCLEMSGDLGQVLDTLGGKGILSVLVEGGPSVARSFHAAGLVNRYLLYVAPALFGGDDGLPLFTGPGAPTIAEVWRGRFTSVERLGDDLRLELLVDVLS